MITARIFPVAADSTDPTAASARPWSADEARRPHEDFSSSVAGPFMYAQLPAASRGGWPLAPKASAGSVWPCGVDGLPGRILWSGLGTAAVVGGRCYTTATRPSGGRPLDVSGWAASADVVQLLRTSSRSHVIACWLARASRLLYFAAVVGADHVGVNAASTRHLLSGNPAATASPYSPQVARSHLYRAHRLPPSMIGCIDKYARRVRNDNRPVSDDMGKRCM
jgi:hypothetical protein